jgi:hypothetical protein
VLNQTPQTIQRYCGKPLKVEVSNDSNKWVYTYSITEIRQILPGLPEGATFGMTFINNRVLNFLLMLKS